MCEMFSRNFNDSQWDKNHATKWDGKNCQASIVVTSQKTILFVFWLQVHYVDNMSWQRHSYHSHYHTLQLLQGNNIFSPVVYSGLQKYVICKWILFFFFLRSSFKDSTLQEWRKLHGGSSRICGLIQKHYNKTWLSNVLLIGMIH